MTRERGETAEVAQQQASIRRFLREDIRRDWAWTWPQDEGAHETRLEHVRSARPDLTTLAEDQWVEREVWQSDVEDQERQQEREEEREREEEEGVGEVVNQSSGGDPAINPHDGYATIAKDDDEPLDRAMENILVAQRRRRQRERLREELRVNDGLRCFMQRQQAWTCAKLLPLSTSSPINPSPPETTRVVNSPPNPSEASPSMVTAASTRAEDVNMTTVEDQSEEEADLIELRPVVIPLAPPLISPDYAGRQMVSPQAYDTIYAKVVSAGATPNVPINLSHVVRACVQGWKSSGEWPPKTGVLEASIARRRRSRMVAELFGGETSWTSSVSAEGRFGGAARRGSAGSHRGEMALKGFGRGIRRMLGWKAGKDPAAAAGAAADGGGDGDITADVWKQASREASRELEQASHGSASIVEAKDADAGATVRASTEKSSERERL